MSTPPTPVTPTMPSAPSKASRLEQGTSFFTGAHNFRIDRQTIIGHQVVHHHHGNDRDLRPAEPSEPILDASYTRNRKASPPDSNCLPGTRRAVIEDILSWAKSSTSSTTPSPRNRSHIMWVHGYVGCGKSAIAQAVAETFANRGKLGASFFFFRGSGDRSRTRRFAATIASQLAASVPLLASPIKAAMKKNPDIFTSSLEMQFQRLVYEPFTLALKRGLSAITLLKGPYLMVVDGLDEGEDSEEIAAWIRHMVAFFVENPRIPLRVLISSRVEEHIRAYLDSPQVTMVDLVDRSPLEDIAYVMTRTFEEAARDNRVIGALPKPWPAVEDLARLKKHTGGSFVFMVTILKFILERGANHTERLVLALDINPGLDGLYAQTLSRSNHLPHFYTIISTLAYLEEPLSISALAKLLGIERFEVIQVLVNLHPILQVPGSDDLPVTLCHSSLYDFLHSEERSGPFHANPTHHRRMAQECIKFGLLKSHQNLTKTQAALVKYSWKHTQQHWLKFLKRQTGSNQLTKLLSLMEDSFPATFSLVGSTHVYMKRTLPREFLAIPNSSTMWPDFLVNILHQEAKEQEIRFLVELLDVVAGYLPSLYHDLGAYFDVSAPPSSTGDEPCPSHWRGLAPTLSGAYFAARLDGTGPEEEYAVRRYKALAFTKFFCPTSKLNDLHHAPVDPRLPSKFKDLFSESYLTTVFYCYSLATRFTPLAITSDDVKLQRHNGVLHLLEDLGMTAEEETERLKYLEDAPLLLPGFVEGLQHNLKRLQRSSFQRSPLLTKIPLEYILSITESTSTQPLPDRTHRPLASPAYMAMLWMMVIQDELKLGQDGLDLPVYIIADIGRTKGETEDATGGGSSADLPPAVISLSRNPDTTEGRGYISLLEKTVSAVAVKHPSRLEEAERNWEVENFAPPGVSLIYTGERAVSVVDVLAVSEETTPITVPVLTLDF